MKGIHVSKLSTSNWGQVFPKNFLRQNVIIEVFLKFWTFCQTSFLPWANYVGKLIDFSNIVTRRLKKITWYLWATKFFKIISREQTSRSGFIGHMYVLWSFSPISWKQRLKKRPLSRNIWNIVVSYTLSFSCSQTFLTCLVRKTWKLIQFEHFSSVDSCHIRQAPNYHSNKNGATSLFYGKLLSNP